jgi:hypothetical protein
MSLGLLRSTSRHRADLGEVAFVTLTIGRTHATPARTEELPVAPSYGRNRQTIHLGRAAAARGRKERTS